MKVPKKLECLNAIWFEDENSQNLEKLVRSAWKKLPNHENRSFKIVGSSYAKGLHGKDFGATGFAIQCVNFRDGEPIGTVPMQSTATNDEDIGSQPPNPNENYLGSDIFAFFNKNLVLMTPGKSSKRLVTFLHKLFETAELSEQDTKFDIQRKADTDKLKLIEKFGVEKINLSAQLSEASLNRIKELEAKKDSAFSQGMVNILRGIRAIAEKDNNHLMDSVAGRVQIGIDVKTGDLDSVKNSFANLSKILAEDEEYDDPFIIELKGGGGKIKSEEIILSKGIRVSKNANTVSRSEVWEEMNQYASELLESKEDEV